MNDSKNKSLGYYLLYGFSYLHSLLPFSVLYFLSDILYVIVYHIIGYRRKIVRGNLVNAFKEKDLSEIVNIEKRFYHFLCDYYFETIKLLYISDKEVQKRMQFVNPELIDELTRNGKTCILSLGHYGNWEYVPSINFYKENNKVQLSQIYKKLQNTAFDDFFLKLRSRFETQNIEMNQTYRTLLKNKRDEKSMVIGFLSDQRPRQQTDDEWISFLGREVQPITGMERIARQFNYSVLFLTLEPIKRGHYKAELSVITRNAAEEPEFYITETYFRKLEQEIIRNPPYYLWSHNRWSQKREKVES